MATKNIRNLHLSFSLFHIFHSNAAGVPKYLHKLNICFVLCSSIIHEIEKMKKKKSLNLCTFNYNRFCILGYVILNHGSHLYDMQINELCKLIYRYAVRNNNNNISFNYSFQSNSFHDGNDRDIIFITQCHSMSLR